MFTTIVIFVVVLGILVLVHEWGHFITAKKLGIQVDEFGIGFPPRMLGIQQRKTLYSINWIPLGGFVKIKGEAGESGNDPDSFASKKAWKKISVLAAGVVMNFVLAAVLLSVGFMTGIPQEVTDENLNAENVRDVKIVIAEVAVGSPAERAGIQIGDKILNIDDNSFESANQAVDYIATHSEDEMSITVERGSESVVVKAAPELFEGADHPVLGIAMIRAGLVRYGFFESIYRGIESTASLTILIVALFGQLIAGLFTGGGLADQISGPLGVAVLTGQVAQLGIPYLINFTAMLSINLGILNIIPFPALDGGRILFVILEKIKGRPISPKIEGAFHNIGFSLLILLVIFVTFKDFGRYGADIWSGVISLFS